MRHAYGEVFRADVADFHPDCCIVSAGYDLHAVIELVECGCPPALAVRILTPLDDFGRAG